MSYCRFSDNSDVYVFHHVGGYYQCCSCLLAEKMKSIFTVGLEKDDIRCKLFGENIQPCGECHGAGCDACMLPSNTNLNTKEEMIVYLLEHQKAGHKVPKYAIDRLKEEIELEEGN